jgi:hypothetical protein
MGPVDSELGHHHLPGAAPWHRADELACEEHVQHGRVQPDGDHLGIAQANALSG